MSHSLRPYGTGGSQARTLEWVAVPSPGDLPDPAIEPASLTPPALAGGFFTISATWETPNIVYFTELLMLQINLFYKDGKEIEYVVLVKIYF